jgi:glycosyltransferase involved in cell wall biosynthesis
MHVAILTTRIAGTDGVSLEAERWRDIFREMGHQVTFIAGKLDRSGIVIPKLHFQWPKVVELHDRVVYSRGNYKNIEAEIFKVAGDIEGELRDVFHNGVKFDLLVVPNVFSIPMHFPLAVALARLIEEDNIPTIARHHDFWWERERFNNSTMFEFFKRWFPPLLPSIKHVVINSIAKKQLKKRTGANSEVIWDTFDFSSNLNKHDSYSKRWRGDFGIGEKDIVFLQATRIVPRKRIELSIELVSKLGDPRAILVIAGYSGDEGRDYGKKLRGLCKERGIRYKFIGKCINSRRRVISKNNGGKKLKKRIYTLWDCFLNCDFVTYPTTVEGFGNQFIETMYFKKPIIITPYPVFDSDIKPCGFKVISMSSKVTEDVVERTRNLIDNSSEIKTMVDYNYKLGKKHFDYKAVKKKLKRLIR